MGFCKRLAAHHSAGDPGTTATKGGGVAVGVPAGMHHESFAAQISGAESRSHHAGGSGAVVVHHQAAEVTAVAIAERSEMFTGFIGIPVPTCSQAGHHDAVPIGRTVTAAIGMQVETVFTGREAAEAGNDFQPLIAVAGRHRADRLTHPIGADPMQCHVHAGGLGGPGPDQNGRHHEHQCDQAAHEGAAEPHHSAPLPGLQRVIQE